MRHLDVKNDRLRVAGCFFKQWVRFPVALKQIPSLHSALETKALPECRFDSVASLKDPIASTARIHNFPMFNRQFVKGQTQMEQELAEAARNPRDLLRFLRRAPESFLASGEIQTFLASQIPRKSQLLAAFNVLSQRKVPLNSELFQSAVFSHLCDHGNSEAAVSFFLKFMRLSDFDSLLKLDLSTDLLVKLYQQNTIKLSEDQRQHVIEKLIKLNAVSSLVELKASQKQIVMALARCDPRYSLEPSLQMFKSSPSEIPVALLFDHIKDKSHSQFLTKLLMDLVSFYQGSSQKIFSLEELESSFISTLQRLEYSMAEVELAKIQFKLLTNNSDDLLSPL